MKNTMIPDSIWINAHIQTMDDSLPSAQAFAVAGGRITALGTDDEILSLRGPQTEIHDLEGHFVYPGFIEGHMHLPMYGDSLLTLPSGIAPGRRSLKWFVSVLHSLLPASGSSAEWVGTTKSGTILPILLRLNWTQSRLRIRSCFPGWTAT